MTEKLTPMELMQRKYAIPSQKSSFSLPPDMRRNGPDQSPEALERERVRAAIKALPDSEVAHDEALQELKAVADSRKAAADNAFSISKLLEAERDHLMGVIVYSKDSLIWAVLDDAVANDSDFPRANKLLDDVERAKRLITAINEAHALVAPREAFQRSRLNGGADQAKAAYEGRLMELKRAVVTKGAA